MREWLIVLAALAGSASVFIHMYGAIGIAAWALVFLVAPMTAIAALRMRACLHARATARRRATRQSCSTG